MAMNCVFRQEYRENERKGGEYVEVNGGDVILETEHLCYSYDGKKIALKDVNVSVRQRERIAGLGSNGEKWALFGPNGAGKSTCFLNLNGVLTPDSGRILYRGTEITKKNRKELRKHVGIVFQEADNQIIASTVAAEVSFGPMNLKLPVMEVKRRVDEALECMNLTEMKDRPPHYLSGGEKKRVCIADIVAMESELFLFDEPTASLDPLNAAIFEAVLDKLWNMGKTLLISTHDVDFTWRWADRALVFSGGRLIADDAPCRIFQDESVIVQANLRKPVLMDVCSRLAAHGIVPDATYVKDTEELEQLLCR